MIPWVSGSWKCSREKRSKGSIVRFLYDDIGSRTLKDSFFRDFLKAGGQKAAFFPSRIPFLNYRVNYRNHRKLVVIDGQIGYIGGFNIGNEYLGLNPKFGYWRDTHLRFDRHALFGLYSRGLSWIGTWHAVLQMEVDRNDYFPDCWRSAVARKCPYANRCKRPE